MIKLTPVSASPTLTRDLDQLAVELSAYCNLQCKMCSVWEIKKMGVPLALAKTLLDDAYALGARTFTPCGAESFFRKDFLEIVEYAHALGYQNQEIVTNGTMLTDDHLDRLQKLPSVQLHISIDGPREIQDELRGEGVYDKCLSTAKKCISRGIRIGLSGVILRETLPHLHALVDLAAELGVGEVSFQPFQTEISGPDKEISRFSLLHQRDSRAQLIARLEAVREHARARNIRIFTESLFGVIPDYLIEGKRPIPPGGCYLPSKFLLVDWRGDVYPCFFMRQDKMGNVYNDSLRDIWHSVIHKQLQVLALTERCPGCLAACSDVETFNEAAAV
jgi:MoaA/NifB/PqqE/SkfB family radical SAM enzyme